MRNEHVYALNVLNIRPAFHLFGAKFPAETAVCFRKTDIFIVNMRGGRTEFFGYSVRIFFYAVDAGIIERGNRGEKVAFRLYEGFYIILAVKMPDVQKSVFFKEFVYYAEITFLIKLRYRRVIIATGFNGAGTHILPQTA